MIGVILVLACFTVVAFALPTHLEWLIYGELDIPSSVTQQSTLADVRDRLSAKAYVVTNSTFRGSSLFVVPAGDDRFRAWIEGLGSAAGGYLFAEGKFEGGYFKGDSWEVQHAGLAARIDKLLIDANLSVDPSLTSFGDNDFALNGEFGLFMVHGFLVLCVAGALVIRALVQGDGRPERGLSKD